MYDKLNNNREQIPLHILNYMKKIEEQIKDIDKECKSEHEFNNEFINDRVTKKMLNKEMFIDSISGYFNY